MWCSALLALFMLEPPVTRPFPEALRRADQVAASTESKLESKKAMPARVEIVFQITSVDVDADPGYYVIYGTYKRPENSSLNFLTEAERNRVRSANAEYDRRLKIAGGSAEEMVGATNQRNHELAAVNQVGAKRRQEYANITVHAKISRLAPVGPINFPIGKTLRTLAEVENVDVRTSSDLTQPEGWDTQREGPARARDIRWKDLKLPANIEGVHLLLLGEKGDWPTESGDSQTVATSRPGTEKSASGG